MQNLPGRIFFNEQMKKGKSEGSSSPAVRAGGRVFGRNAVSKEQLCDTSTGFRSGTCCSDIFVESLGPGSLASGCPDRSGGFPSAVLGDFSLVVAFGWTTVMREQLLLRQPMSVCSLPGVNQNSHQNL